MGSTSSSQYSSSSSSSSSIIVSSSVSSSSSSSTLVGTCVGLTYTNVCAGHGVIDCNTFYTVSGGVYYKCVYSGCGVSGVRCWQSAAQSAGGGSRHLERLAGIFSGNGTGGGGPAFCLARLPVLFRGGDWPGPDGREPTARLD